jgi:hypothetical protein
MINLTLAPVIGGAILAPVTAILAGTALVGAALVVAGGTPEEGSTGISEIIRTKNSETPNINCTFSKTQT